MPPPGERSLARACRLRLGPCGRRTFKDEFWESWVLLASMLLKFTAQRKALGETRMSSRLLEERQEREQAEAVAAAWESHPVIFKNSIGLLSRTRARMASFTGTISISSKAPTPKFLLEFKA